MRQFIATVFDDHVFATQAVTTPSKEELEAKIAELEPLGYYPVRVQATSHWYAPYWEDEPVFAAVFARTRKGLLPRSALGKGSFYPDMAPLERTWTITGIPVNPPLAVQQIDAYMKEFLELRGIFGAQIAVADGDQLKLLRAYTSAPSGYPITQPTTRFPLGSISKAITGSATLLLWMKLKVLETQNGEPRAFNLGLTWKNDPTILVGGVPVKDHPMTLLQDRLQAGAFDGSPPRDLRFRNELTIRHCCTQTGGWLRVKDGGLFDWGQADDNYVLPAVIKANADEASDDLPLPHYVLPSPQPPEVKTPTSARVYDPVLIQGSLKFTLDFPVQPEQLEAYVATVDGCIEFDPGSTYGYSGTGPFMLGRLITLLTAPPNPPPQSPSYADWAEQELFVSLGVPQDRTRPEDTFPPATVDSALTHDCVPDRWLSVNDPKPRPTVPSISGDNFVLAHTNGAWVAPAVDVVRFLASFSRTPHPIYSALANPADVLFNTPLKGVSFFWNTFDVPDRSGQAVPARWHNGQVVGGTAIAFRRDDGLSVVVTVNQNMGPAFDATGKTFSTGSLQMNAFGAKINELINQIPLAVWNTLVADWTADAGVGPWPP